MWLLNRVVYVLMDIALVLKAATGRLFK